MTQKTISQETLDSRLLTGAWLELQDLTSGSLKIAIDDFLAGVQRDTPSQTIGATTGNTMEVEANTLAARARLCPPSVTDRLAGWKVSRHQFCGSNYGYNNGANAVTDNIFCDFSWVNTSGIAIIKKVNVSLSNGATSGNSLARAGVTEMKMWRLYGLDPLSTDQGAGAGNVSFPPSMQGVTAGVLNVQTTIGRGNPLGTSGMVTNQPPSQARIEAGVLQDQSSNLHSRGYVDKFPLAQAESTMKVNAGITIYQNVPLYDWQAGGEQPLILVPGTGFQLTLSNPAITGTSVTNAVWYFATIQWEEWTLVNPGDPK